MPCRATREARSFGVCIRLQALRDEDGHIMTDVQPIRPLIAGAMPMQIGAVLGAMRAIAGAGLGEKLRRGARSAGSVAGVGGRRAGQGGYV